MYALGRRACLSALCVDDDAVFVCAVDTTPPYCLCGEACSHHFWMPTRDPVQELQDCAFHRSQGKRLP